MKKNVYWCSCPSYPCQILVKLEFSRQILEKTLEQKISRKFFQWVRWREGRTDRHDEANSRLSQFCERA